MSERPEPCGALMLPAVHICCLHRFPHNSNFWMGRSGRYATHTQQHQNVLQRKLMQICSVQTRKLHPAFALVPGNFPLSFCGCNNKAGCTSTPHRIQASATRYVRSGRPLRHYARAWLTTPPPRRPTGGRGRLGLFVDFHSARVLWHCKRQWPHRLGRSRSRYSSSANPKQNNTPLTIIFKVPGCLNVCIYG